jgi:hypothetical protein
MKSNSAYAYYDLRLQYALENSEVQQLLKEAKRGANGYHRASPRLIDKLKNLGIETKYLFWRAHRGTSQNGTSSIDDFVVDLLTGLIIKVKFRLFTFRSEKENNLFREILTEGFTQQNERWLMQHYATINFSEGMDRNITAQEFHTNVKSACFSKETKKFFRSLKDSKANLFEEIEIFSENHLSVEVDLTKNQELLLRELHFIIGYFKSFSDELKPVQRRQQNLELYQDYLRVYKLVKEKKKLWMDIAAEIFPYEFAPGKTSLVDSNLHPETALAKVQYYFKKAQQLIENGLP